MDIETGKVRLTDLASCGGCAAKYSAARLEELLQGFVPVEAENLLVGLAPADDAAVYSLDDERALIFTLDFFPPVVDDPGDYGAIAATNALNDVFAMGGTPLLALSIAAFPEELPMEMLGRDLRRSGRAGTRGGGLLAGGHTIRDAGAEYGLAVIGTVHPTGSGRRTVRRPATRLRDEAARNRADHDRLQEGARREQPLTRGALDADAEQGRSRRAAPLSPNAVTDVTGFGLFGHAHEMADRSGVAFDLESERFPAIDGALDWRGTACGRAATRGTAISRRGT